MLLFINNATDILFSEYEGIDWLLDFIFLVPQQQWSHGARFKIQLNLQCKKPSIT